MFGSFGWPEIILLLVIVIIIFGVGKLPQVGGAIGKSIKEFRKARAGEDDTQKEKPKEITTSNTAEPEKKEKS